MLEHNLHPTIFERRKGVGGLWSSASGSVNLNPIMQTNLSRYGCTFSDLAWPDEADVFPVATEMGGYLEAYRKRYIPDEMLRLGCSVTSITKEEGQKWKVSWTAEEGTVQEQGEYDFLALCTGFYSEPFVPPIPVSNFSGTFMHTSSYKWPHPSLEGKKKIVVVGGSLSGVEMAAELALRVSSLPEHTRNEIQLIHLFARPFWTIPRHFPLPNPEDPLAPRFLPNDIILYDVNQRRSAPPPPEGMSEADKNFFINSFLSAHVGSRQEEISPNLHITDEYMRQSPWVAISDSYLDFVRSGRITPMIGRLAKADGSSLFTTSGGEITDVDAVVMGSGYYPANTLQKILSPSLFGELADCEPPNIPEYPTFLPLLLYKQCLHPALKSQGGFVGMYKGAFLAILELQGRWLASLFSGSVPWPSAEELLSGVRELGLARQSHSQGASGEGDRSQWTNGDYIGNIDDLRKMISLPLTPDASPIYPNPVCPAHISPEHPEAIKTLASMQALIVSSALPPPLLGMGIFKALHGNWELSRTITSSHPSFPSGVFTGTATFHPRAPTFSTPTPPSPPPAPTAGAPSSHPTCSTRTIVATTPPPTVTSGEVLEYLYSESGTFTTASTGLTLHGRRQYIYRYHHAEDAISVWFVKPDDDTAVDYFFHDITIVGKHKDGGWEAKSQHLCKDDWYWPKYRFGFKTGGALEALEIGYEVKGPMKEYVADAKYRRA